LKFIETNHIIKKGTKCFVGVRPVGTGAHCGAANLEDSKARARAIESRNEERTRVKKRGHKKLENTGLYTQLINFESDEWHVAHPRDLKEENKLIEAGFEYVRYSEKDKVVIYRKRK
jgi:hypothetical protein